MSVVESSTAEIVDRPCRYQIREKCFVFGCNFKTKDNTGRHRFTVRPQKWNLYTKLIFEDSNGKYVLSKRKICLFEYFVISVLLKIQRKRFRFLDQYSILSARNGESEQEIASIRQKLTFFKHSYMIYSTNGEYKMKGLDIFDHSFTLTNKDGKSIAIVNKKFFSLADTYGIEMIDSNNDKGPDDHAFILALIIVLHCSIYCS